MLHPRQPTLYLVCGKIAAGKSTLAALLAESHQALLVSEDHWMSKLFFDELKTIDDYDRCSTKLRAAIGPQIVAILKAGLSVVLDFPANTIDYRAWMRSLFEEAGARHELHFLDVSDVICKERLARRNQDGCNPFQVSEAEFDLFTGYFEPPDAKEGFELQHHRPFPAAGI